MYSKLRKPLCIFLVTILCFGIFGCSPEESVQTSPTPSNSDNQLSEENQNSEETEDPNKLTLYLSDLTGMSLNTLLTTGVKNGKIPIPDIVDSKIFNTVEEMETQLVPELLAGGGPDIFIFDNRILPNFKNYIKQGLFVDLNELINQDTSSHKLDLSLYNQTILEIGKWEEKQYFIPLGFRLGYFLTTQEMCDQYDIVIPEDGISYEKMPLVFENYIKKEKGKKALISSEELLRDQAYQHIDMSTQNCTFNTNKFKDEISIYDALTTISTQQYREQGGPISRAEGVRTGDIFCAYMSTNNNYISILSREYNSTKKANLTPILFGLKDEKTDGYIAFTSLCFAINVNSPKKDLALSYLKNLLGESFQNCMMVESFNGLSILNSVREDQIEMEFFDNESYGSDLIARTPEGEAFVNKYIEIANNITSCYMVDGKWEEEIFTPVKREYVDGKITADQFAQTLQQKTNIFLKE